MAPPSESPIELPYPGAGAACSEDLQECAYFFIPDGFGGRSVFARLSKLDERTLRELLEQRWRRIAQKAAVKASIRRYAWPASSSRALPFLLSVALFRSLLRAV
jgi:hypothetical protein